MDAIRLKNFYGVLKLQHQVSLNGECLTLPTGQWYIPVFSTKKEAEDFVNGDNVEIFIVTVEDRK